MQEARNLIKNIIRVGVGLIGIGAATAIIYPLVGIALFLFGVIVLCFGLYAYWRLTGKMIINPSTAILGIFASFLLLIVELVGVLTT